MAKPTFVWRSALAALLLGAPACYRYVPAELTAVPAGEDVRLHLSRAGMEALQPLSADPEPIVSGLAVRRDGERLLLRIPVRARPETFYGEAVGQDVWIPTAGIVQLERREIDRVRTGLLTAASVGAAAAVLFAIMDDAHGGMDIRPPGDDTQMQGFSIPIPLMR